MNIAILIGASEYRAGIQNLPGCKNDIQAFESLIKITSKYNNILCVDDNCSSAKTKEKLINFINLYKTSEVEEVLFYFTGHGDYAGDDFFYILPDFDFSNRHQTSLQNSELDNLIKSLNPKLVVKIVDACQSGVNYIKEVRDLDEYIKSTKNQYNNCYFLYSSLNTQSSFQNENYSFFTLSFFNAIKEQANGIIRYKNLIDYISDKFIDHPEQTPFFVTQADFTEIFCHKTDLIESNLKSICPDDNLYDEKQEWLNIDMETVSNFESIVKNDAKRYISLEKVNQILSLIKESFEKFSLDEKVECLYEIKLQPIFNISKNNYAQIIGRYLQSKPNQYFASIEYRTETYTKIEIPRLTLSEKILGKSDKPYEINKEREVIDGYSLDAKFNYAQLELELISKYPNVDSYQAVIAYICSDKEIRLYYFLTNYIRKNWTQKDLNDRYEWDVSDFELIKEEEIYKCVENLKQKITQKVLSDLEMKFK